MKLTTSTNPLSLRGELAFLVALALWLLFFQAALRGLFMFFHFDLAQAVPTPTLLKAFAVGIRFDLIITVYALLPLIFCLLFQPTSGRRIKMRTWLTCYAAVITFLAVLELDFYKEFHQRLNSLVIEYMKEDPKTVLSMIWFGFPVVRYLVLVAFITFLFHKAVAWIDRHTQWQIPLVASGTPIHKEIEVIRFGKRFVIFAITLAIALIAARGTLRQGPPLRWGDAFFSEYTFANHLALNGTFTLGKAATSRANNKEDNRFWFKQLPDEQARSIVRDRWLTDNDTLIDANKAAIRRVTKPPVLKKPIKNVVIILMESFSGEYVGALGNEHGVTPAFDALAKDGVLFKRFFSNGTHTHQGMFATFACFPNLPNHEYLMYQPEGSHSFSGIAKLLSQRNYNQLFVYNGSFTWDNQEGFFKNQGMNHFVGREDYINPKFSDPTWGVSDEDMFDRALLELGKMPKDKPFLAILQTLSNHTPYGLPDPLPMEKVMVNGEFSERLTAMRYADYALGKFFEGARKSDYYKDTLFVMLGDHGFGVKKQLTAVDLLRFHVPLLLIGPGLAEQYGHTRTTVATQVDVIPTVMSLLGQPYQHQCWGRDALNLPANDQGVVVIKPSGNDPTVAIVSDNHVLVRDPEGKKNLYTYQFQPESAAIPENNPEQEAALWKLMQAYIQTALITLREDTAAP